MAIVYSTFVPASRRVCRFVASYAATRDEESRYRHPEANSDLVLARKERRFVLSAIMPMRGLLPRFLVPIA